MSRRSERNRRAVNYADTADGDEQNTELPDLQEEAVQQPGTQGRRGRRGRAATQRSDDVQTLQPATQRGDSEEERLALDTVNSAEPAEAVETESQHAMQTEAGTEPQQHAAAQQVGDSVEEALNSEETQSDEVKDDAEQSDSDEEWSEERPRQSAVAAAAADERDEAIVLSDDEVDNVFSLTRPAHAARMRDARREASSGHRKKPRAAHGANKKPSTLLQPPSIPPPSKGALSQRSPVTVSKDEAILLEDSLDAPPTRPSTSTAATSTTAATRPASAALPTTSSRKPFKSVNSKLPFKPRSSEPTDGPPSSQATNLASMRAILGPALPDSTLLRFLVSANYNCERAISNVLDSPQLLTQAHAAASLKEHHNRAEPSQPQLTNGTKRSRETSDGDKEDDVDDDVDDDDKRWSETLTAKQPTGDNEERMDSEKEAEKEEELPPVPWDRKLLVVLRVEASCTTEGTRVVSLDESVTFRDQSRDTYHQRMIRTQLQQQSQQTRHRKHTKQLRKDLRAERRKEHRILRFVPSAHLNALEIGTLPRAVSDMLVPLFDRRLIDLSAVVTSPCPLKFDLLSSIPLLLSVYALPAVFQLKREVRVETKGFLGKVVSTAADQQLNPVDTFLALLSSFHIEPVSSSIREEGTQLRHIPLMPSNRASAAVVCSRIAVVCVVCLSRSLTQR